MEDKVSAFGTIFNDNQSYQDFIQYFNELDVFYISDFKVDVIKYLKCKSPASLISGIKQQNYIQFAGTSIVNNRAVKKYIRVNYIII